MFLFICFSVVWAAACSVLEAYTSLSIVAEYIIAVLVDFAIYSALMKNVIDADYLKSSGILLVALLLFSFFGYEAVIHLSFTIDADVFVIFAIACFLISIVYSFFVTKIFSVKFSKVCLFVMGAAVNYSLLLFTADKCYWFIDNILLKG